MEQDWSEFFRLWFYDDNTSEAVIVLEQGTNWRAIRLLDPIWLVNCSKQDIGTLYDAPFYYRHGFHDQDASFKEMALQFRTIVKMCFGLGIHSGCHWEDVNSLYRELMILQDECDRRDKEILEKERLVEEERLRRIPRSVVIRASDNFPDEGTSGGRSD